MPNAAPTLTVPNKDTGQPTLTVLVAPGDPTGYPITHPYIGGTGTHAIFVSGGKAAANIRAVGCVSRATQGDEVLRLASEDRLLPAHVILRPWVDPVVDRLGLAVTSAYVERVWLGVLGPSSAWALRRLGSLAAEHPDGVELDLAALATDLGLGGSLQPSSRLARSVDRLSHFGMVRWANGDLFVRVFVGLVPTRSVGRLTPSARAVHDLAVDHVARGGT